jgi:putative two-component system response regulator
VDSIKIPQARILLVDDEMANLRYLERALQRAGFTHIRQTQDPRQVLPLYQQEQPDLIILDLMMPYLDGFAVMAQVRELVPAEGYLPILVLTADATTETKQRALASGATDFLTKPFDPMEVTLRTQNLVRTRLLHVRLERENEILEEWVKLRTQALVEAQTEILERLARAAEYRDDDTGQHAQRVGVLAAALADAMGLPAAQVALLRQAAPLHDVGKIGVSDAILLKEGPLTPTEVAEMQAHTTIGARILAGGKSPLVQVAQEIALTHHERWDGTGYPHRLIGERIPLVGRIVAIADAFDALTHIRPYKNAWSLEDALIEIQAQGGKQFDPAVVTAVLHLSKQGELAALMPSHGPVSAAPAPLKPNFRKARVP